MLGEQVTPRCDPVYTGVIVECGSVSVVFCLDTKHERQPQSQINFVLETIHEIWAWPWVESFLYTSINKGKCLLWFSILNTILHFNLILIKRILNLQYVTLHALIQSGSCCSSERFQIKAQRWALLVRFPLLVAFKLHLGESDMPRETHRARERQREVYSIVG